MCSLRRFPTRLLTLVALTVSGASAQAADAPAVTVVALPPLTTPATGDKANEDLALGWQATQLIATDLRATSELMPLPPNQKDYYSYPEVTAPTFSKWRSAGAKALVTGFVQTRPDGRLTIGCYVYDVDKGRELGRKGFVVGAGDWRRAAHKCSGLAYQAITGAPGIFDTRIAYVAESGSGDATVRRIALMDSDGFNHGYITDGQQIALGPQLSPTSDTLAYVSFVGGIPQVMVRDLASKRDVPAAPAGAMSFSPAFSPDGRQLIFSMIDGVNTDLYLSSASGGPVRRLTNAPGIDTHPSFSPDGRQIVFESDRSGNPQLYVIDSGGGPARRLTFGAGWYATPEWSPDGQWIAFTSRSSAGKRVGIIRADGSGGERILTDGQADEAPSWAPSSRELIFQRSDSAGRPGLYRVATDGSAPRAMTTPQGASDPSWSTVRD